MQVLIDVSGEELVNTVANFYFQTRQKNCFFFSTGSSFPIYEDTELYQIVIRKTVVFLKTKKPVSQKQHRADGLVP